MKLRLQYCTSDYGLWYLLNVVIVRVCGVMEWNLNEIIVFDVSVD